MMTRMAGEENKIEGDNHLNVYDRVAVLAGKLGTDSDNDKQWSKVRTNLDFQQDQQHPQPQSNQ